MFDQARDPKNHVASGAVLLDSIVELDKSIKKGHNVTCSVSAVTLSESLRSWGSMTADFGINFLALWRAINTVTQKDTQQTLWG